MLEVVVLDVEVEVTGATVVVERRGALGARTVSRGSAPPPAEQATATTAMRAQHPERSTLPGYDPAPIVLVAERRDEPKSRKLATPGAVL